MNANRHRIPEAGIPGRQPRTTVDLSDEYGSPDSPPHDADELGDESDPPAFCEGSPGASLYGDADPWREGDASVAFFG